jgi:hypothetical protein
MSMRDCRRLGEIKHTIQQLNNISAVLVGRTSLWYHVGWDCDNPAQLGSFSEQEAVAHPRKEMRETVMASSNALGDVSASTGEGQRVDAVVT